MPKRIKFNAKAVKSNVFNAQGQQLTAKEAKVEAKLLKSRSQGPVATACLTLYNPLTALVTWKIEITFNPCTLQITGGSITGTICGSGYWNVTGGNLQGGSLVIHAARIGGPSCCATQLTILGTYQSPPSYKGTYGFNSTGIGFKHTTLYCCGVC